MPRRKKHIITVSQLPCYDAVVAAAFQNLPELASGFDASTLQLVVSEPIIPKIKDIDTVIDLICSTLNITCKLCANCVQIENQRLSDFTPKSLIIFGSGTRD
ncbi:MAG: hypothetical protein LBN06_02795 [Prevotellaceae bacterium]|nr:hypothetical protein [Prevotellaceae bacterium]